MRFARILGTVIITLAILMTHVAHATLTNCAALSDNPGDYKVVLDDFGFSQQPAHGGLDIDALNNRLQFNLKGQLEALQIAAAKLDKTLQVPVRLVFCVGRRPSVGGQEFTDALAERLSDQRVVVEVWGTLDRKAAAAAAPDLRALIGYAIPPLQHYVPAGKVRAIQTFTYPKAHGTGVSEELDNLPELSAFALIGLGTKAARANRYDLAIWAFTRAEAGMADAKLGGTDVDVAALLDYTKHSACVVRGQALADTNYKGGLRALPAQSCAGVL